MHAKGKQADGDVFLAAGGLPQVICVPTKYRFIFGTLFMVSPGKL
jgi:hypothetical protein